MGRRIGNGRVPARCPRILSRVQAPYVEETTKILLRLRIPSSKKRGDSVRAPNCWEDPGPFESTVALANKVETTIVLPIRKEEVSKHLDRFVQCKLRSNVTTT